MPARYYGDGSVRRLKIPEFVKAAGGIPIRPRNLEQQFFMDALLDDSLSLVTCFGKAGTGKTLISTVCALQQTQDENSRYDGVSISRPVISRQSPVSSLSEALWSRPPATLPSQPSQ